MKDNLQFREILVWFVIIGLLVLFQLNFFPALLPKVRLFFPLIVGFAFALIGKYNRAYLYAFFGGLLIDLLIYNTYAHVTYGLGLSSFGLSPLVFSTSIAIVEFVKNQLSRNVLIQYALFGLFFALYSVIFVWPKFYTLSTLVLIAIANLFLVFISSFIIERVYKTQGYKL